VPAPVVILLPPSEGKQPGGTGRWSPRMGRFAGLGPARLAVAGALADAMDDEQAAARLTGVSGEMRTRARTANLETVGAPARPAWQRYSGVVWDNLDPATLTGRARMRAGSIVVVSALGGLFGFEDPVPDYKCKLGARLVPLGSLGAYWRPRATAALAPEAAGGVVWDLLPDEHSRAVDVEALGARRVIRVELRTGGGRAIGHGGKSVKGRFVRHVLERGAGWGRTDVSEAVEAFASPEWSATLVGDLVEIRSR
jgi:cytoplasmic iron level regulating protein YaaA (DUF328/UPF0246 family)